MPKQLFQKGHKPFKGTEKTQFKKGHKVPQEWREKWSIKRKGKRSSLNTEFKKGEKAKNWNGFGKGQIPWNKGLKGLQSWHNIIGFKPGWNKGKRFPKISEWIRGEKNHNWRGGISPMNMKIRGTLEYK